MHRLRTSCCRGGSGSGCRWRRPSSGNPRSSFLTRCAPHPPLPPPRASHPCPSRPILSVSCRGNVNISFGVRVHLAGSVLQSVSTNSFGLIGLWFSASQLETHAGMLHHSCLNIAKSRLWSFSACAGAGHERAGRGERGAGAGRAGPRDAHVRPIRARHRTQARPTCMLLRSELHGHALWCGHRARACYSPGASVCAELDVCL